MAADRPLLRIDETAVDSEFCSARQNAQSQLAKHGFKLDSQHGGELPQALPVEVLGMAFEDFDHNRGSPQVQTIRELHPRLRSYREDNAGQTAHRNQTPRTALATAACCDPRRR